MINKTLFIFQQITGILKWDFFFFFEDEGWWMEYFLICFNIDLIIQNPVIIKLKCHIKILTTGKKKAIVCPVFKMLKT